MYFLGNMQHFRVSQCLHSLLAPYVVILSENAEKSNEFEYWMFGFQLFAIALGKDERVIWPWTDNP